MKPIIFSREDTQDLVARLISWSRDTLDQPLGQLQAEELLDLIRETVAPAIYNQALADAATAVRQRADDLAEAIEALERPVGR
ncbi:MAG: DUF2164 domain-containing protein [Brevundimonas sp.]|nr:MAG: DUF2164 domain-containing protein [Brevundimonas sp.]